MYFQKLQELAKTFSAWPFTILKNDNIMISWDFLRLTASAAWPGHLGAVIAENTTVKRSSAISKNVSFWAGQIPAGQTSPKGTISEMAARAFYCCLYAMTRASAFYCRYDSYDFSYRESFSLVWIIWDVNILQCIIFMYTYKSHFSF